jgi:O-antigen/teichoic acid export membrane protein
MKQNYLYNLLFSLSNILFPVITFPYVSRVLGPEGIGKVQFVVSFAQYFTLMAALGIPIYGIQAIASAKNDQAQLTKVFSELTVISLLTGSILSIAYLMIIFSFSFFEENINLFLFAGIIVLLNFTSIEWLYSGLEEFRTIAIRSLSIKVLSLVLLFAFVKTKDDYLSYLLVVLFTIQGSHFFNVVLASSRTGFTLRGLQLKKHLKPLTFIFSTTVAGSMYTILDTVLLGFLADDSSVGFYTAAVKLNRITLPIVTSLGVVLIPQIARNFSEHKLSEANLLIRKGFHFIALFTIPIAMGLCLLAPQFIEVFSGSGFLPAVPSMQILALLPVFVGLGHLFVFVILVPAGYHKEAFYSMSLGVAICFLLNFILVPSMSELGAAVANVCTELAVTCSYFYFIRKHFSLAFDWMLFLKSFTISLVFIPIVTYTNALGLDVPITLVIAVASCTFFYLLFQLILFKDSLILNGIHSIKQRLR